MSRVIIRKRIAGCFASLSSEDVDMHFEISMPLDPYEGLCIQTRFGVPESEEEYERNFFELSSVIYDLDKGVWLASETDDKTIYEELRERMHSSKGGGWQYSDEETVGKLIERIKEWEERGWEVQSYGHHEKAIKKEMKRHE